MTRQRFVDRRSARAACAVPATGTRPARPVGRDPFPLRSCRARRADRGWPSAPRCGVTAGRSRRGEGGAPWRCSPLRPARASLRRGHDVPPAAPTPTCRGSSPASLEVAPANWVDATTGIRHGSGPLEKNWGFHRRIHHSSRPLTRAGVAQRRRQHAADARGSQRRGGRCDRFSRSSPVPVSPGTRPPSAGSTSGPHGLRSRQRLRSRLPAGARSLAPPHPCSPGPHRTDQVGSHPSVVDVAVRPCTSVGSALFTGQVASA